MNHAEKVLLNPYLLLLYGHNRSAISCFHTKEKFDYLKIDVTEAS